MKHLKIFKLFTMSMMSFMAFAGSASADLLTDGSGGLVTSFHASANGHVVLDAPFGTVECNSTVAGNVTSQGAGQDVTGTITTLDFTNCTGNKTVTVLNGGNFTLDVTQTNTGTLSSFGASVTVRDDSLGMNCLYETSQHHIGSVAGGTAAKLTIGKALIPRLRHSFFCGTFAEWTGSYTFTSPHTLHLDPN